MKKQFRVKAKRTPTTGRINERYIRQKFWYSAEVWPTDRHGRIVKVQSVSEEGARRQIRKRFPGCLMGEITKHG